MKLPLSQLRSDQLHVFFCTAPISMIVAMLTIFNASATPYSDTVLADSPLAYYQFEESGGTIAADSSGNSRDGSFVNIAGLGFSSTSAQINLGTSLDFSGGHVRLPNLGTHAQSSVELWLQLDTIPPGCCAGILTTNGWNTGRIHLNVHAGRFEHAVNSDSPVSVNTTDSISTGTWYHLIVTNDVAANETIYYLNGAEVADTGDHSAQNIVFGVNGMQIGAWDGGRLLDGLIDEVAIYGQVLSPERAAAHFDAASDPGTADILSFTASDGTLSSDVGIALPIGGGTVTLTWNVEDAEKVEINNGALAATEMMTGSIEVAVTADTTFTLSATNPAGLATSTVSLYIAPELTDLSLTEFMAENDGSLLDGHGASPDWIEIHNPNRFALDLTDYRLLDGASSWPFPPDSTIPALGYLVVFASGNDSPDPAGHLHTNFSLENSGEYVGLLRADGTLISEFTPTFPKQFADISYGRHGDPLHSGYFIGPTPGAENGSGFDSLLDKIGDTIFAIGRGFFTTPFDETISTLIPGSSIIYTTDGSIPSESNGTRVDSSDAETPPSAIVSINGRSNSGVTTLRAILVKEGSAPSNVDTQTYLFSTDIVSQSRASTIASGWPSSSVNGQVFDYGMTPDRIGPGSSSYTVPEIASSLESIPTVSLVTGFENLVDSTSGIYVNARNRGRGWERPVSVELIFPDGYVDPDGNQTGFQIDAGLRIRGGASRGSQFFKHGFRLFFRGEYGDSKLRFPLFGTEGTDDFDKIDLRSSSNFDWARESDFGTGEQFTFTRDLFSRDTQGALGQAYTKSRYYHLYLNGAYWGIYQTEERPEASFGASYFGGDSDDYDTVKSSNHVGGFTTEATDGNLDAFEDLWNRCREIGLRDPSNANYFALQGLDPNGVRDPTLPVLLDVEALIDYMLVIFWTGDGDAVLSNFLGSNRANNWFGNRNRNSDEGFRFFAHDAEHTLGNSTSRPNRTGPFSGSNQNNFLYANPQWMHQDLMANAEYRLHFADRVQKHFFRTGALTEPVAIERFNARTDQVRPALRAYGARWADARYTPSYNTGLWETEIAWITNSWMPGRTATVLIQLRADALYPDLRSPLFEDITGTAQPDGEVSNGFQLHLTDPELAIDGTIYYTLDGSDPRSVANPPPLISPGAIEYTGAITINGPTTVNARLFRDHEWSALTAASFHTGSAGPSDQNLVISQIQYHPASIPGDTYSVKDYEYLELMNIGSQTLALGGLHLREDISFDFPQDAFLAPGERVQIVSNSLAFDERHVASPTHVLGEFTRNLSNSGGRLHLLSDSEGTIRDFEFGDDAPWPTQADGDGFGLVLIQPMSNPDHFNPANWRRSLALHGSPGESDTTGFSGDPDADADADGDGLSALLEYALGTSDNAATPNPWTTGLSEDEIPQFEASITRRINADDVLWSPEFSLDLVQWTDASGQILNESIPSADPEFVTEHYRFPLSGQQGHSRTFIRVRVELR